MRKRLFNDYDAMNPDGYRLSDDVCKLIRRTVKLWLADGWDGRDVQAIVAMTIDGICAEEVLRRAMETRKFERETARAIAGK